ncbi:MAG TPA: MMPL family transporter [Candidatus Binatia bacterium]|nr:MMPL family transporter [Candidatus Binatia bacterium]
MQAVDLRVEGGAGKTMAAGYARWVMKHARAVVALVLLLTLVLLTRAARLKVEVNPDAQLPQRHPYIQALTRLHEIFGEKNLVFVGLFPENGDVYEPKFLAKLARITERIGALPGLVQRTFLSLSLPKTVDIRGTNEGMAIRPFLDPLPKDRDEALELRDRLLANPQYLGTIVAADSRAAGVIADFDFQAPLDGYPEIQAAVTKVLEEEQDGSFRAHLSGPAIYVAWLARYSARMFFFFPLAFVVIGLVHYEAFRTLQAMFLPLLTALLAMLWSLGLLGLLGVTLDPFNVTTPILILAVAAGHAVQMLKRFYEELAISADQRLAVERSFSRVAPVMIVATSIASLSFLSLLTFETAAIRNFGLFTALGIVSSLAIEMTLIPALRCLLPAPTLRERTREGTHRLFDPIIAGLRSLTRGRGRAAVLVVAAVIASAAALGGSRVVVDSSFRQQFFHGSVIRRDDRALNAAFGGTSTLVLLIEGDRDGAIEDPRVLEGIDSLQTWFASQPGVGKTLSFVDFVKRMNEAMNGDDPAARRVPATRNLVSQYLLLYTMSSSAEDFDSLIDPSHRVGVLRVYLKEDSTRFAEELIARLRERLPRALPSGVRVEITGSLASSQAMNEVMVHGKILNILQIAAIILFVASVTLRSLIGGVLVAIPLALAVVTNFGVMDLFGIPLDIGTATISAMAVGIGADYAVYFLFRLREEIVAGKTLEAAVERTLDTSGMAILFVSSAIAAGYLTLCFSGFGYHVRLGTLVALAMAVSSAGSLTVLPALVLVIRPRFLGSARPLRPGLDGASARA